MSPENAHKLIRIYMGGLILGVNTLYMLSCFLKQFALVGKGLKVPVGRLYTTLPRFPFAILLSPRLVSYRN